MIRSRAFALRMLSKKFASCTIRGATLVSPLHSHKTDIHIKDGKIFAIGERKDLNFITIDASGKLVIPGGIDTHTHMQLPFMGTSAVDDFQSGSKACLAGGTTSFIDFVIPDKGQSLLKAYDRWRSWADNKVHCDYGLHCAITSWNQQTSKQMGDIVKRGISSFKFFMAYKGALQLNQQDQLKAFERAKELGAICLVHAQNGDLIEYNQRKVVEAGVTGPEGHYLSRPPYIQADCVHRAVSIATAVNTPLYVVHIMSKEASQEIQRAKAKGLVVFAQTLAAVLGTDGCKLWDKDFDVAARYVMSPPLGPNKQTKEHLMKMLQAGVLEVVGTDNCTFCTQQKRLGQNNFTKIPNGVNGLQDRLSVVWTKGVKTGLLSHSDFVNSTSTKAARIFNMFPKKGDLSVGSDADLVIWNPEGKRIISAKTHKQKVDYNIFQGMQVQGLAQKTFSKGKLVWDGEKIISSPGDGKFISRHNFGFAFERIAGLDKARDYKNFKVERQDRPNVTKQASCAKEQHESQLYKGNQLVSLNSVLTKYLPQKELKEVRRILFGSRSYQIPLSQQALKQALQQNFQIKNYKIDPLTLDQTRLPRVVKIAAIQNSIVRPTTDPVHLQKQAIMDRVKNIIEVAALQKANIVCLQQIWNAPFFMCTRQKFPWIEFAEKVQGQSTQMLKQLSKKHNMVIISSILELDEVREVFHNSALVIEDGQVIGKQHKNHIPRVGDFNESTYYMEGLTGHIVFQTRFGKLAVNICYGRHHPLNWMAFGLNGAEVVFNPSATVGGLSEPLWPIEARNAAIANHYFAVGINRVGTQIYPNAFTSGDGKPPKKEFGHFYGSSYLAAPDGSRTPGLSRTQDGLLLTEIDLNMCRQVKSQWGFTMTARFEDYAQLLQNFTKAGYKPQIIKKE